MKIVRLIGGLGNQMFQYSLFTSLKARFGAAEAVKVDTSCFRGYNVHNGLEIERVFGVELPQASLGELLRVTRPVYNYKLSAAIRKILPARRTECFEASDYTFNDEVFAPGDRYYWGYWQNWRYFIDCADEIRKLFRFSLPLNEATRRQLDEMESRRDVEYVSVHVRRGDYLKAPNYAGLCGPGYYRQAVAHVAEHVPHLKFLVFSDDLEWCSRELAPLFGDAEVTYVDWNRGKDSALDMMLMSRCRHNIIANSSFSWWGAFLNASPGKIVCAPRKWTNTKVNCTFQLPEWTLFD